MSLFGKKKQVTGGFATFVEAIDTRLQRERGSFVPAGVSEMAPALEDISAVDRQEFFHQIEGLAAAIEDIAGDKKYTEAQREVGAFILAAGADDRSAARFQRSVHRPKGRPALEGLGANVGITLGSMDQFGYTDNLAPALESYDNSELSKMVGYSVKYNMDVMEQDSFAEAFFRTHAQNPDMGGSEITIRTPFVWNHALRGIDGDAQNMGRTRLIEAAFNHEILAENTTDLIPQVKADDSNAKFFIDAAIVPPVNEIVDKQAVRTAPLAMGVEVALINISQASKVARNGVHDITDVLDRTNSLKSVYLEIGGEAVKFNTAGWPNNNFSLPGANEGREQVLHFRSANYQLNEFSVNAAGGVALTETTLVKIVAQKLKVNVKVDLAGRINLDSSNATVSQVFVAVDSIYDATGKQLDLTTGLGLEIANGLADLRAAGWDPLSRVSNSNKRERGQLLDLQSYTERYYVPLGVPVAVLSPLHEDRDPEEMNFLVSMVRQRTSSNALTTLIAYEEQLNSAGDGKQVGRDENGIAQVEGIGRFLLQEIFSRRNVLKADELIVSLNHTDVIRDTQSLLVNALRDGFYTAMRDTGYMFALEQLYGPSKRPTMLVGCDPYLERFLRTDGDPRTIGDGVQMKVVSSVDRRMVGKIYWTLVLDDVPMSPLTFGTHILIPELVSSVQITRGQSTSREATVQPRSRHVPHLPIVGMLEVTGLNKILLDFNAYNVKQR